jgi:hypothetical protein
MNYHQDYPEYFTIGALILASLSGILIENIVVLIITALILGLFLGRFWNININKNPTLGPFCLMGMVLGFTFTNMFSHLKIILLALFIGVGIAYALCEYEIF